METARDAYLRMLGDELTPRLKELGFIAPTLDPRTPSPRPAFQIIGQDPGPTTAGPADLTDFRLPVPGHHVLLGLHEYWANNSASFQFTVNILATSHTAWATFRAGSTDFNGNPWPSEPTTSTHYGPGGPPIARLGQLMGLADKWWYISPRRPTEPVAEEIATAVQHHALPAINELTHP
ncbi:hypothetical protein Kisp01_35000 [Kineosporia sp. NBRC 101677]|uniref:hypothetical protein n=1 Tax=Kineosporia sp. NBRC 101677 TaxID=3032197 RepID=UPI0024A5B04D|nr:hypothetical protein [Kineosporia sp. NBRC 101677]GLY16485.1 hypothetical protein Kisp01_35000 [Kineosporia sp. NBRC 101677]